MSKEDKLIEALEKIEQMSDPGSPETAIARMKSIATEALKFKPLEATKELHAEILQLKKDKEALLEIIQEQEIELRKLRK